MVQQRVVRVASKLLTVALAGPAAIHILGKLNEKVEFSDILTRIVWNFRLVSRAVWATIFAWVPNFPVINADVLTLAVLIIIPTLLQKPTLRELPEGQFYIRLSLGLTYLLTIWFIPFPGNSLVSLAFISVIFLSTVEFAYRIGVMNDTHGKQRRPLDPAGLIVMITATFAASVILNYIGGRPGLTQALNDTVRTMVLVFIFYVVVQRIERGAPGPLYAVLLAGGLVGLNWLSTTAKPAMDTWLTHIGA